MELRKVVGGLLLSIPVLGWAVLAILTLGFLGFLVILGVSVLIIALVVGGVYLMVGD